MIVDANSAAGRELGDADVCIVGAGAAGITLALALESSGQRVVLLESGGHSYDPRAQRLFEGLVAGDRFPTLRDTRLAAVGGSTGIWAGFCRPLEPQDFAPRHGSPGWPLTWDELEPYWRRAHDVCGLLDYDYSPERWSAQFGHASMLPPNGPVRSLIFHVHAMRFGAAYRAHLAASRNVTLALHAVVTRLHMSTDGSRVEQVAAKALDGGNVRVRAGRVVLAGGGIENARLLLLSGDRPETAPGNGSGLVGRYFTDHPFIEPGYLELDGEPSSLDHYFPHPVGGGPSSPRVRGALSLEHDLLERERLLNGAFLLLPRYEAHDAFASREVKSFLEAFARLRGKSVPGGVMHDLIGAITAPRKVATAALRKLLVQHGPARRWRLRAMFETESRFENRVTLGVARDRLGRRQACVQWNLSARDVSSMIRFTALVDEGLRQAGVGRIVQSLPHDPARWRSALIGGKHHMGTTRMHRQAASGVVDADGRVHGTTDLYVCGSSIFPSGGFANPTLTIVALALRLADHLKTA